MRVYMGEGGKWARVEGISCRAEGLVVEEGAQLLAQSSAISPGDRVGLAMSAGL